MLDTRICPICSASFEAPGTAHNKIYCSRKCKNSRAGERYREKPLEERRRVRPEGHTLQVYKSQKDRGVARKIDLIRSKGGACQTCGYKKNLSALVFHHLDPSKKDMSLDMRTLSNNKLELLLEEADKCILLCHNCHNELHNPTLNDLL